MKGQFTSDVQAIRRRAREHMEQAAITESYTANRETVLQLLNDALATEIICVLRYRRHYYTADGLESEAVAEEFAEHARDEQEHADRFAERIVELGGEPDFSPNSLAARSHSEYVEGADLVDMIQENLVAERIAIDSYREIIRYLGADDPTTRRLFEEVLQKEEEHAHDMADLLGRIAH